VEKSSTEDVVLKIITMRSRVNTAPTYERCSSGIQNPTASTVSSKTGAQQIKTYCMPIKD